MYFEGYLYTYVKYSHIPEHVDLNSKSAAKILALRSDMQITHRQETSYRMKSEVFSVAIYLTNLV
jgi:hypothetical protein